MQPYFRCPYLPKSSPAGNRNHQLWYPISSQAPAAPTNPAAILQGHPFTRNRFNHLHRNQRRQVALLTLILKYYYYLASIVVRLSPQSDSATTGENCLSYRSAERQEQPKCSCVARLVIQR